MRNLDIDIRTLPATKQDAVRTGSRFYFTGKPCKHGHISPRYTTSLCLQCHREWSAYYYKKKAKKSPTTYRAIVLRELIHEAEADPPIIKQWLERRLEVVR